MSKAALLRSCFFHWVIALGIALAATTASAQSGRCSILPEYDCGEVCQGDCDADGRVSMADLMLGVNDLLDRQARCGNADGDMDGRVSIDEMIGAVGFALDGCPAYPAVPRPGSVSFILSWLVYADAPHVVDPWSWPEPPVHQFSVYSQRIYESEWSAQRRLSPGSVVAVGVAANGAEVARWSESDSRWVYFDCIDPRQSPLCLGGPYQLAEAAMSVYLPYDPAIVELRIFETKGDWGAIELVPLGTLAVEIE